MTEQTPEQQPAPAAAPYDTTTPAPADAAPQVPQESTAAVVGDGAAPAGADSTPESAPAGGSDGVAAGDLVTWVETDADGYEHTRNGLVTEVLELPGDDDAPALHARISELPEARLLPAERLRQL